MRDERMLSARGCGARVNGHSNDIEAEAKQTHALSRCFRITHVCTKVGCHHNGGFVFLRKKSYFGARARLWKIP